MKFSAKALGLAFLLAAAPAAAQVIIGGGGGSAGGAPSGAAGGDLTGTYPNPALATVNANPGTYGDAATCIDGLVVNAKGLITAINETACDAGAGDITGVTAGAGLTGGGTSGAVTLSANALINAQTGTSYTIDASDAAKLVTFSNGSAVAVTVPQATSSFGAGFSFGVQNKGAGTVTLTPTTSTINGGATLAIAQDRGCWITSDGTNWQVDSCTALVSASGGVSSITGTANQITASASTGAVTLSLPSAVQTTTLALNGCTIGANALCTTGAVNFAGSLTLGATNTFAFSGRGSLSSIGSNNLNIGGVPSGTPVAQTLGWQNATGSNVNAAATGTIVGPLATGTGTNGDTVFSTGTSPGSGSSGGTVTEAFRIKGETQTVVLATGKFMRWPQITPASSSDTCTTGDIKADANYIYVCTASNTFKRAALSTF